MSTLSELGRDELISRIHPNTLKYYDLPEDAVAKELSPVDLLNSRRLDVVARILYAREYLLGLPLGWGAKVYENLIGCWTNNFTPAREVEPGRFTMSDYYSQFESVINSMQVNNFSGCISIIPTSKGTIVDGAHRLAAAVALNLNKVVTVEMEGPPQEQDYKTLLDIGMEQAAVESLVLELIRLKETSRLALLFPCSSKKHDVAITRLKEEFLVDYHSEFLPTLSGVERLMTLCYGMHDWWEGIHALRFSKRRFKNGARLTIVCFQGNDDESIRLVKDELRALMGCGNDGMHTTDSHEETVAIAEVLLNQNGRNWLNVVRAMPTPRFELLFSRFRDEIISRNASEEVCVDAGGVLAVHGLRDVTDLDYLELRESGSFDHEGIINCHNGEYHLTNLIESEIILDPRKHFYYRGIRFASLSTIEALKISRGSRKDLDDVRHISSLHAGLVYSVYLRLRLVKESVITKIKTLESTGSRLLVATVKITVPLRFHPLVKRIYLRLTAKNRSAK